MKTREQILEAVKSGKRPECIDGRDFGRLIEYFPETDLSHFGYSLKDNAAWVAKELTRENILEELRRDVDFGFQKALRQRGISAGLMNEVVKMWLWVLDDPLQDHDSYAQYGLPLLKAVAIKYGLPNAIGEDTGDESKYSSE